jgi:hypothetical protein
MTEDFDEGLPMVAASEADLITMARALIVPHQYDVWAVLCRARRLPPAFGETCAELLADTLRQLWPAILRRGGTQPDRAGKRLWERHPRLPLVHTNATTKLIRWLAASPFAAPPSTIETLPAMPLSLADQVIVYLALDIAAGTPAQVTLARQPFVRGAALAWFGFAHLFDVAPPERLFDELVTGGGAVIVEALSAETARRWFAVELGKRSTTSTDALIRLGAAQDGTLKAYMAACDRKRRRDLATFILDAALPLFQRRLAPTAPPLDPTQPLSTRMSARNAIGALLRAVVAWSAWDQEHRGVRFIDDGYDQAQFLLHRFERVGAPGVELATQWLSELAALAPT